MAVILMADDAAAQSAALDKIAAENPLVYAATEANYEAMVEVAKKYEVPLAVYAEGLEALDALVEKSLRWVTKNWFSIPVAAKPLRLSLT